MSDRIEYLKKTHSGFIKEDDKVWELWTKATNVSIFMNTSLFDNIPDVEHLRSQLWELREQLEMVDGVTLKKKFAPHQPSYFEDFKDIESDLIKELGKCLK